MNLQEINTALEEAIRFGQREINTINSQYANRVLVGVEYEIEFPEFQSDTLPFKRSINKRLKKTEAEIKDLEKQIAELPGADKATIDATYNKLFDREIQKTQRKISMTVVPASKQGHIFKFLLGLVRAEPIVDLYHRIERDAYDNDSISQVESITRTGDNFSIGELLAQGLDLLRVDNKDLPATVLPMKSVIDLVSLVHSVADERNPAQAMANSPLLPVVKADVADFDSVERGLAELVDDYDFYLTTAFIANGTISIPDDLKNQISQAVSNHIKDELRTAGDAAPLYSRIDKLTKEIEELRSSDIVGAVSAYFLGGSASNDYGISKNQIRSVEREPSITNGAEVITKPLPLLEAFDVMTKMFKFIDENGATSEKTGMHCNISIKGLEFVENNFNPAKLIILSDEKYITKYFPFRKFVGSSFVKQISPHDIYELLYGLVKFNSQYSLIDEFIKDAIVNTQIKHQTINTLNASPVVGDIKERRVEFRFPGDADYHKKFDQIQWFIYRSVQMLLAGFDPDYGRKEYMSAGLDAINTTIKTSRMFGNLSLGDLLKIVRDNKDEIKTVPDVERFIVATVSSPRTKSQNAFVYQQKTNPNFFIVTVANTNNIIWVDAEAKKFGDIPARKIDLGNYKMITKSNDPSKGVIVKLKAITGIDFGGPGWTRIAHPLDRVGGIGVDI